MTEARPDRRRLKWVGGALLLLLLAYFWATAAPTPRRPQNAPTGEETFAEELLYVNLTGGKVHIIGSPWWYVPVRINLTRGSITPLDVIAKQGAAVFGFLPEARLLLTAQNARDEVPPVAESRFSVWHLSTPTAPELEFSTAFELDHILGAWRDPEEGTFLVWGRRTPIDLMASNPDKVAPGSVLIMLSPTGAIQWERQLPTGVHVYEARSAHGADVLWLAGWDCRSGGNCNPESVASDPTLFEYGLTDGALSTLLPAGDWETFNNVVFHVRLHPKRLSAIVLTAVNGRRAVRVLTQGVDDGMGPWKLPDLYDAYWLSEGRVALLTHRTPGFGLLGDWYSTAIWDVADGPRRWRLTWRRVGAIDLPWVHFVSSDGNLIEVKKGESAYDLFAHELAGMTARAAREWHLDARAAVKAFAPEEHEEMYVSDWGAVGLGGWW